MARLVVLATLTLILPQCSPNSRAQPETKTPKKSFDDSQTMLVRISAAPSGPLSVINGLPDANLAILEGYNGIGKTLAIRILQLCTGDMPYPLGSPPWQSLCEGLNKVQVEIRHLYGANRVVWVADSVDWQSIDEPVPRTDWFKSITIDGHAATLDDVRSLIKVIRLAGDEHLTDTFALQADSLAATVHRWNVKHASPDHGPLKQLEDLAGLADDLLSCISVHDFAQLKSQLDRSQQEIEEKRNTASQLQARRRQVSDALEFSRRISDMRDNAPALQREIHSTDQQIARQQAKLDKAHEEVTRLAARAGRTESLEKELENAERTLKRNIANLDSALKRAAARAVELSVDATPEAAAEFLQRLTLQETQLQEKQQEQFKSPIMIQMLGVLTNELQQAQSKGLGDQVAVDYADKGILLTVSKTLAGMLTRRKYLEQEPLSPRAVEISQELDKLASCKRKIESVLSELADVDRFSRLVRKNEERVHKALQQGAGGEAAEKLKDATNRRFECDQTLRELAAKRASLAQRLGTTASGASQSALTGQLNSLLESLDVSKKELAPELKKLEIQFQQAEAELAVSERTLGDHRQQLAEQEANISKAFDLLKQDERLLWIRRVLIRNRETSNKTILRQHQDLVAAQELVQNVLDRLGSHRSQLSAIERALQGTARELRGQSVDAFEYVPEIQAWLASSFSNWFNEPRVRSELLKNADQDSDVTVDLETRKVTWTENRNRRSRPLEAFSSGEQAFAYTRARLALLEDSDLTAKNRLIILDEFGAFISQHLLEGMIEYLKEWTNKQESDRVLLILPLGRDYTQMTKNAIGARAKQYRALAQQVTDHGYATRTIVR